MKITMQTLINRTCSTFISDFSSYRIVFLILGTLLITLAPTFSESLIFYYSSAMAVGIVLVVLIVLFQVITSFWYNYPGNCAFTIMNLLGCFFPPLKLLILYNYCFELLTGNEASSYWSKKFSCYLYVLDFCEYHTYCFV